MTVKYHYKKIVALLFFITFTCPILSPEINNKAIYLYWFIPFIDIYYIKYLFYIRYNKLVILSLNLFIIVLFIFGQFITILKVLSILLPITYLIYAKKNNLFNILYICIFINIFIAIFQFILLYVNPQISYFIGPSNIAKMIWGDYATETFTNFYTLFLFPRVSGLSREAGFFSSLLVIVYIIYLSDSNEKKSKIKTLIFLIGFILSFSKITFVMVPVVVIIYMKNFINRMPYFLCIISFILCGIFVSNNILLEKYYNPKNTSIIHRFSGYTIMSKISLKELILGSKNIEELSVREDYTFLKSIETYGEFTGLPNTIIHKGLIVFTVFLLILYFNNISLSGFFIITFLSATTDYFTATSFIVLGYFYIFCHHLRSLKYNL